MHEYSGSCKTGNPWLEMAHYSIYLHDRSRVCDEFCCLPTSEVSGRLEAGMFKFLTDLNIFNRDTPKVLKPHDSSLTPPASRLEPQASSLECIKTGQSLYQKQVV